MTGRHRSTAAAPTRGGGPLLARRDAHGVFVVGPRHAAPPDWYTAGWAAALTDRSHPCTR